MLINKIISTRNLKFGPSWESVFEWENIISKEFDIPIGTETWFIQLLRRRIDNFGLQNLYNFFCSKDKLELRYIMTVTTENLCVLSKNTIPVIIDFWLKEEEEINAFFEAYKRVSFIIVSSLEVYEKLKKYNPEKNIYHLPLSLPDIYLKYLNEIQDKKYNLVTAGRVNPYFSRMLAKYCEKFPEFEYVVGKGDIKNRYFETNKGKYLGDGKDMESYYKMINSAKIAFYSTPGCDEAKHEANGYNQVTPRFLELISGGCFIIAHYTDNPDTRFYQLGEICQDTKNYTDFETQMNYYLKTNVKPDPEKYRNYLRQHVTSNRMLTLKQIFNAEGISY